jgi:flagellar motor protein MotB
MNCPVCPNANIPAGEMACSNCGADITAIRRLQELPSRWYNEALASLRAGTTEAAIASLYSAAAIEPDAAHIRRLLGKALWEGGRTAEAIAQWRMLPDDEASRQLLQMVPAASEKRRAFGVALLIITIVVALAAIAAMLVKARPPLRDRSGISRASMMPMMKTHVTEQPPPLTSLTDRLSSRANVRVERRGGGLMITFADGLFASGSDIPTISGHTTLRSMARDLAASSTPLHVMVEGFTDSKRPRRRNRWADNWSLGFSRAHNAVQFLRRDAGTAISWSARSGGDVGTPYVNDGEASRARNRTVVLHVEARSDVTRKMTR